MPRCEKCGAAFLLKRGTSGRFCTRVCYETTPPKPRADVTNKGGRKPWADHGTRQAAIIRALASGPLTIGPLAEQLQLTREVTKHECGALKRLGRVVLIASGGAKAWALPGATRRQPGPAMADVVDDLELEESDTIAGDVDEVDADVEQFEIEPPAPNVGSLKSEVRSTNARGKALRQPVDSTIKKDAPPAWWVGADPSGFTDQARSHQARMRASKESTFVPFRMLQ